MSEFKGTRGEAVLYKPDHIGCINVSLDGHVGFGSFIEIWYHQFENGKIEAEANANLIVDAFKVRQQINCELSELLEFVKSLANESDDIVHPEIKKVAKQLIKK